MLEVLTITQVVLVPVAHTVLVPVAQTVLVTSHGSSLVTGLTIGCAMGFAASQLTKNKIKID